jgi:hypothetical protein
MIRNTRNVGDASGRGLGAHDENSSVAFSSRYITQLAMVTEQAHKALIDRRHVVTSAHGMAMCPRACCMQRQNVILTICTMWGDGALNSTRKHVPMG